MPLLFRTLPWLNFVEFVHTLMVGNYSCENEASVYTRVTVKCVESIERRTIHAYRSLARIVALK